LESGVAGSFDAGIEVQREPIEPIEGQLAAGIYKEKMGGLLEGVEEVSIAVEEAKRREEEIMVMAACDFYIACAFFTFRIPLGMLCEWDHGTWGARQVPESKTGVFGAEWHDCTEPKRSGEGWWISPV
jgi:hypothetical protein